MQVVPSHRASDADREQAATRLQRATAEGRLTGQELEERLEALFTARTYGEIAALLADLPVPRQSSWPRVRVVRLVSAVGAVMLFVTMLATHALVHRRSEAADLYPHSRRFGFSARFGDPHQFALAAVSMVGVFAVVAACGALAWMLMRWRPGSRV